MKEQKKHTEDLARIRSIMEKSSRYDSLSGVSGVLVGVYAIIGSIIVAQNTDKNLFRNIDVSSTAIEGRTFVIITAVIVLTFSLCTVALLTKKKAAKRKVKVWNSLTRRIVELMATPLISGGLCIIILSYLGLTALMIPMSLIFFGISFCNISRYTYAELYPGGMIQITLGLIALLFLDHSLLIWAIGFGGVNIVLGIILHLKHEK